MEYLERHPFVRQTVEDKALGVMIGSAIGDSIGLYTEFLSKESSEEAYPERKFSLVNPVTEWRNDSHRNRFDPACWTDDTDHAILILLSYLRNDGVFITDDFAARLRSWCEQGLRCLDRLPLGLGRTVGSIVLNPGYLDEPENTAYRYWVKSMRHVAPNGSLMRTHPLGIMCLPFSRKATYTTAMEFSRVTHVDPRCVLSCCVSTVLISEMLRGKIKKEKDIDNILEEAFKWVNEEYRPDPVMQESPLDRQEFWRHVYAKNFTELQLDDSMRLGYVYKCLGSGILCLRLAMRMPKFSTNTFETIITDLIMEGGDSDTNACCAGALLGALLGYSRLPPTWRDGLMHREWMTEKVGALCQVVGISEGQYSGVLDPDVQTDEERGRLPREALAAREKMLVTKVLWKDNERKEKELADKQGKSTNFSRFFGKKPQS